MTLRSITSQSAVSPRLQDVWRRQYAAMTLRLHSLWTVCRHLSRCAQMRDFTSTFTRQPFSTILACTSNLILRPLHSHLTLLLMHRDGRAVCRHLATHLGEQFRLLQALLHSSHHASSWTSTILAFMRIQTGSSQWSISESGGKWFLARVHSFRLMHSRFLVSRRLQGLPSF